MDWDRLNHVQPLLCWYKYMQMRDRRKVSLLLFQLSARQDGDSVILGESQGSQGVRCGGTHESPSQQLSHENQVEHVWTINSQMLMVLMLEARKVLLDAESDLVDDGDAGDDERRRRSTMMGGDGWWWWCWAWHSCLVVLDARLDAFGGWKPRCRTFSDWFTSLVQTGAVGIGYWFGIFWDAGAQKLGQSHWQWLVLWPMWTHAQNADDFSAYLSPSYGRHMIQIQKVGLNWSGLILCQLVHPLCWLKLNPLREPSCRLHRHGNRRRRANTGAPWTSEKLSQLSPQ